MKPMFQDDSQDSMVVPIATYATSSDLIFGEVTIVASIYTARLITELKALIENGCSHNCAMCAILYADPALVKILPNACIPLSY